MSQVPVVSDGPVLWEKAMPPMTWNGTLASGAETETHYLHLSVFACEKCKGPVVVGSLGTRRDDISKETDIKEVGAVCIACGFRPGIMIEQPVEHRFRPVEWNWVIQDHAQPAGPTDQSLQITQDTDANP
jgi:hypothetical protein